MGPVAHPPPDHTNTHTQQTPISPAGFKHAVAETEPSQTHALDHAVTGIGKNITWHVSQTRDFSSVRAFN
jgi:hypothetical protein